MHRKLACLILSFVTFSFAPAKADDQNGFAHIATQLSSLPFDGGKSVTVRGKVTVIYFAPPGTVGMMGVNAIGSSDKYVFSTAPTKDMAKQGLSRYTLSPGREVVVTATLAKDGQKLEGYIAARADSLATTDGHRLFDRASLTK